MERTTDWKVPAALILAGLALLVALSGRNALPSFSSPQPQSIVVAVDRADPGGPDISLPQPADPSAPGDSSGVAPKGDPFPVKPAQPMPNIGKVPLPGVLPADPAQGKELRYAFGGSSNPLDGIGNYIQGLIEYLSPLFQLGAIVLLIWLAYRYFTQRNRPSPGYTAAPPAPQAPQAPPANHGDIVQPESRPQD